MVNNFNDTDIKIAGDKPSETVRRNLADAGRFDEEYAVKVKSDRARTVGKEVAVKFIDDADAFDDENFRDYEMLRQRRLLLSFTATVGFEKYLCDDTLAGIAQKSFLDTVRKKEPELYDSSSDTGAFSFYYLAYRRGLDIERRIGQTFAMLCSHDGDPIFQELGEALYCWFSSVVKEIVEKVL